MGGAGLINFLVFPANADITNQYPELYNSLLPFFSNFDDYKIAYPIAYTIVSDYLLYIHVPNHDKGIDINNDDTHVSFIFESAREGSTASETIRLVYDKNTQEIYSRMN